MSKIDIFYKASLDAFEFLFFKGDGPRISTTDMNRQYPVGMKAWTKQCGHFEGTTDEEVCIVLDQVLSEE